MELKAMLSLSISTLSPKYLNPFNGIESETICLAPHPVWMIRNPFNGIESKFWVAPTTEEGLPRIRSMELKEGDRGNK